MRALKFPSCPIIVSQKYHIDRDSIPVYMVDGQRRHSVTWDIVGPTSRSSNKEGGLSADHKAYPRCFLPMHLELSGWPHCRLTL